MITSEQLKKILPACKTPDLFIPFLNEGFEKKGFNKERQCCFIAQVGHESTSLTVFSENLNYSAKGLLATFGKYFTPEQAQRYARQPEKIANHVYANRLGNGDENSGDGWKHRGFGAIQLTGKDNQLRCSLDLFGDDRIIKDPSILTKPEFAIKSAFWFWEVNKLNEICDKPDDWTIKLKTGRVYVKQAWLTKKVNGGNFGLQERIKIYNIAKAVL